jgi:hypothetical protein
MALINHEKKFIFFHLFKSAGSSMRKILTTHNYMCNEIGIGGHALPRDIKEIMYQDGLKDIYDDYFKFTVVRNPFDWMVGTYFYIMAYKSHINYEAIKDMNLAQFIQHYVDVMMLNEGRGIGENKCVTIYDFVSDSNGDVMVDYIGKYENLKEDMPFILKKVGIEEIELPVINTNPLRQPDYKQYYDAESISLVEKYFAKDLEYFNYKF